jgi:hypothetical protein
MMLVFTTKQTHLNHIVPLTSNLAITHRMEVAFPSNSANEPAIHRLVDDILAYIFLLNATPPDPESKNHPTVEHARTMAFSQVCTRWRSIALNYHAIWGLIIDYPRHSLKWIETLLDRSSPSLLDFGSRINIIFLEELVDGGQGVLELVFNHIDRLRIFNVYVPSSFWELVCSRFLQMPAPNLEFMHIFFDFGVGHLTHPLFDNNAPNLQSLGLGRCSVNFTSPVLTPLTELRVDIAHSNAHPTILAWLNILGGMPSLRSVRLSRAISSGSPSDIFPSIHLDALDKLFVNGSLHECVTLVKHLIVPPHCGLRLNCDYAHLGFDQRQLWAIIEKKIDSWAKNAPYRRINALADTGFVDIVNLPREDDGWESKEVDPAISIRLYLSNSQETVPLFHSLFALFERTFFNTTCLHLWIREAFTPSVDNFQDFVNLEKLVVGNDSLLKLLFPLLQHANSVLLPAIKSLHLYDVTFQDGSDSILLVANFLQWRREQGFPVQKINITRASNRIDRKYVLTHIQDTVVEMDSDDSDTEN